MSFCCSCDALDGYVAAIEWRRVQVPRPRASTSGGQSEGILESAVEAVTLVGVVAEVEPPVDEDAVEEDVIRVRARQSAADVQVRHLEIDVSFRDMNFAFPLRGGELDKGNERLAVFI